MEPIVRERRLALALAAWIEYGDASSADLIVQTIVFSVCKKYRMKDDFDDLLNITWEAIVQLARKHVRADDIANQVRGIARNQARTIIDRREARRRTEALWAASEPSTTEIDVDGELDVDQEFSKLMARLKLEYPDQHDVIALTLSFPTREEARIAWQEKNGRELTAANFRQMYHRGRDRLRGYWEQNND
jgi:hypothetical protein